MARLGGAAAVLTLFAAVLSGCGDAAPTAATASSAHPSGAAPPGARSAIRIASLRGPTTMGLVKLMSDVETGQGRQDYRVAMYATADEVVPLIARGEVDVALLPANLASVLYNKTKGSNGSQIEVAAINTLGMLEVVEAGDTVTSIPDLRAKTIYSTGKGSSPEYVLNYLLKRNGLDPAKDVNVEFTSEATEVAALLLAMPDAIGLLPQPYATVLKSKDPTIRTALSLTDEWAKVTPDSQLVTGVVVVRRAFADTHRGALNDFLTDDKASTAFTNSNPAEAAPMIVKAGIVPSAQIAEAAIPACNITYIDGAGLQTVLSGYLQVLLAADPASVGGSLPGDDFYYRP